MFKYKGCTGIKDGGMWMITFEDGTHDMTSWLDLALMLCRKELKRAQ